MSPEGHHINQDTQSNYRICLDTTLPQKEQSQDGSDAHIVILAASVKSFSEPPRRDVELRGPHALYWQRN